jgi:hypothetical protein
MMNNPTRKKAKMPSFHSHQSSNRADTYTTPHSVPSTYTTEQQAYQACCRSVREMNTKLTLALLQLNQITSKSSSYNRITPKTPAASSTDTTENAKRIPTKIPVDSSKIYSSKRIPSKTPAASDTPEPAKRISKNSITRTKRTHTTTPSLTVPSKPIPSKTPLTTSPTEPTKNENYCPPSLPLSDVSTTIPTCSHGIENKSIIASLHNATVIIDHNRTNLEKDRGLFEQPFDTTTQVHSIAPQLKLEVLNHNHYWTKLPPTTSIAPEHWKTPYVSTKPAANKNIFSSQNLPPTGNNNTLSDATVTYIHKILFFSNKFVDPKIYFQDGW